MSGQFILEIMDAVRPAAQIWNSLPASLKAKPDHALTVCYGTVLTVRDVERAAMLYEAYSRAYKNSPEGMWTDTQSMRTLSGRGA